MFSFACYIVSFHVINLKFKNLASPKLYLENPRRFWIWTKNKDFIRWEMTQLFCDHPICTKHLERYFSCVKVCCFVWFRYSFELGFVSKPHEFEILPLCQMLSKIWACLTHLFWSVRNPVMCGLHRLHFDYTNLWC